MVALGTVVMTIGSVIQALDLTVCALASLLVVFVYLEIGAYYPWLVWICTTVCTALVCSANPALAVEYFLIFGIYPLMKAYIERLPKWSWWPVKILYINAVIWIIFFFVKAFTGANLFLDDSATIPEGFTTAFMIIMYVLMNVAFIFYDYFIVVMIRFYYDILRPKIQRILK